MYHNRGMGIHFQGVHGPRLQCQHTREARYRRLQRRWRLADLIRDYLAREGLSAWVSSPVGHHVVRLSAQREIAAALGCSQATVSRDLAHLRRLSETCSLQLRLGGWPVLYCLLAGWGFRLTSIDRLVRLPPEEPTHLVTAVYPPRWQRRRQRERAREPREALVCPSPESTEVATDIPPNWREWLEAA